MKNFTTILIVIAFIAIGYLTGYGIGATRHGNKVFILSNLKAGESEIRFNPPIELKKSDLFVFLQEGEVEFDNNQYVQDSINKYLQ